MISFFASLAILVGGYFVYGKFVEKIFGVDDRETPAIRLNDGVDYVVMPMWKLLTIQLLNIAGLGPIYGALAGAQWGPSVFLWISLGTVLGGGVHDFASGFLSLRHDGASITELTGVYLGSFIKQVMRAFIIILLIMVGAVFAIGPASLIALLFTKQGVDTGLLVNSNFWLVIILIYYFIATFIPIDKIIGKLYPLFGICLIVMAVGVGVGIFTNGYKIPEIQLANLHPDGTPIWPVMFVTVACGAISGFHATQSPLVARCCKSEKQARSIFYGAMVGEGIITLIWAAAGCAIYEKTGGLMTGLTQMLNEAGQANVAYDVCLKTMGNIGIVLAMIGIIVCPITTGDTSVRSARLVIADCFKFVQKSYKSRLIICVPLLVLVALISQINYSVVWRYVSCANQVLAMITLWATSMYLYKNKKFYWITVFPATFMSAVSITYFVYAPECLNLGTAIAYPIGIIVALIFLGLFLYKAVIKGNNSKEKEE